MTDHFKVGVARVDITPPPGQVIHSGDKIAEGIGDNLFAKSLVFDDGETQAALLSADLVLLEEDVVSDIRQRISASTAIPVRNIMLATSHIHTGPATTRWLSPQRSDEYMEELRRKLSTVVVEAWQEKRPARVGVGIGEAKVSVNRWIEMPEGARWGVNWDGPTDNSVNVLRIDDTSGNPFAAMVNFAAHPTVVNFGANRLYTGDYASYLQLKLESAYAGLTALFTNGASGDLKIAFVNAEHTNFAYGDLEDARHYGTIIGEEASRVLAATKTKTVRSLHFSSKWVNLPLQPSPTAEDLMRELAQPEYSPWGEQWAKGMLASLKHGPLPKCVNAEVQVLRLGDIATFVALPGEAFVEIGLRLKELLTHQPTPFIIAYANGYCGYLPSARSIRHDGAHPRYNWHKIIGYPSGYAEEMEDVLVETVLELMMKSRTENATGV